MIQIFALLDHHRLSLALLSHHLQELYLTSRLQARRSVQTQTILPMHQKPLRALLIHVYDHKLTEPFQRLHQKPLLIVFRSFVRWLVQEILQDLTPTWEASQHQVVASLPSSVPPPPLSQHQLHQALQPLVPRPRLIARPMHLRTLHPWELELVLSVLVLLRLGVLLRRRSTTTVVNVRPAS